MRLFPLLALSLILLGTNSAHASRIDPPYSVAKLSEQAALIVKATVISVEKTETAVPNKFSFSPPVPAVTHFRVVSTLKGKMKSDGEFDFYHKTNSSKFTTVITGGGAVCNFEVGRSYLLWAARDDDKWTSLKLYSLQSGALLAPDDKPVAGDIKEVVWQQTLALLKSEIKSDVITGIYRLKGMAQRRGANTLQGNTGDYKDEAVAEVIAPFLDSPDADIAAAARSTTTAYFRVGASIGF